MAANPSPKWSVDPRWIAAGAAAVILLTRATYYLGPNRWYFTFGAFLFEQPAPLPWQAVVIRFGIPLLIGVLLGLLVKQSPLITAGCSGFVGSFVLAWPAIISWNLHAPYELANKRGLFLIIYALYFVSFTYLARSGARLGDIYLTWQKSKGGPGRSDVIKDVLDWQRTVRPFLFAIVGSITTLILGRAFSKP
jgi:hypothetical protein